MTVPPGTGALESTQQAVLSAITTGGGTGGGPATIADGADVAQGTTTDTANANTVLGQLKQIKTNTTGGTGGGPATIADGADIAQGATTDTANANTVVGQLKQIKTNTALGSNTKANSQSVTFATDQGTIPVSQQASASVSGTPQTAATSSGNGTTLNVLGMASAVLSITGTYTGLSIVIEGSEDGTTFSSLSATQLGATTIGSTVSANGLYECSVGGLQLIRARITAISTGSVTVTGHAVPVNFAPRNINANQVNGPWTQNLTQINSATLSNTNPVPVQWVGQSGYVALTSPAAQTNAGSDTLYTFSSQVNTVILQNNTGANLNYAFDVAATVGSLLLPTGQTLIYSKKVTVVHLFTAAATNVNGSSASNIVLLGEL